MKVLFVGDPLSPNLNALIKKLSFAGLCCETVSLYSDHGSQSITLKSLFFSRSPFLKSTHHSDRIASNTFILTTRRICEPIIIPFFSFLRNLVFFLRFFEIPFLAFQLRFRIKSFSPDIIIAYRTQFEGYVAALAAPSRYILFTQGSDYIYYAFKNPLHYLFTWLAIFNSRAVISDCNRDLTLLRKFAVPSKPNVVILGNLGIDVSLRKGSRRQSNVFRILSLRSPAPYIDYDTLFSAVSLFLSRADSLTVQLSILAPISFHRYLLDKSTYFGIPPELINFCSFMQHADYIDMLLETDVVISPSFTDGIPVSVVEAMFHGCFPVAQRLASLEEIISHGLNGFLYEAKDVLSLSDYLYHLAESPSLRLQAANYNSGYISSNYSDEVQLRRLVSFLSTNLLVS